MNRNFLLVLLVILLLSGCASSVTRSPKNLAEPGRVTKLPDRFSSVTIALTAEAKEKAADNLKFNPEELLDNVKRALDANSLLSNENKEEQIPEILIQVKDMRVRSNFSAVMWGFMAGDDHITGDIVMKEPSGTELDRFQVSVSYALGGLAGGQDDARMSWLYEKFAEKTVEELTKNEAK